MPDKNNPDQEEVDIQKLQTMGVTIDKEASTLKEQEITVFIEKNIDMVKIVAAKMMKSRSLPLGIEFDDLVNWGIEGLIKAKAKYKDNKGVQFSTYANIRIRGEILDQLRKEWSQKTPASYQKYRKAIEDKIADYITDTLAQKEQGESAEKLRTLLNNSAMMYVLAYDSEDMQESASSEDPVSTEHEIKEEASMLWDEINTLSEEEIELVNLLYRKNMSQKEVSERMNLSRSKVCRLHSDILKNLRDKIEKKYCEFS